MRFWHSTGPRSRKRRPSPLLVPFFFFNDTPPTAIYTLSLHDALPICPLRGPAPEGPFPQPYLKVILLARRRSEEHTSELQSRFDLVCRLLLEKKNRARGPCPAVGSRK